MFLSKDDQIELIEEAMRNFAADPVRGPDMNYWSDNDLQEWDQLGHSWSLLVPLIVDK